MKVERWSGAAPGKVNLALELIGRRADGFHELRTVMQTIDLVDQLTFEHSSSIRFECDVPELAGSDNLVVRAAELLRRVANHPAGATIRLTKGIPAAAGLGGGSSDAASTLVGLNALWDLGWSRERLAGVAAQLGSDVPFFVWGGTALAEGRGERITPLPDAPARWLVLAFGSESLSDKTRRVFQQAAPSDLGDHGKVDTLLHQLGHGELNPGSLHNALAAPASRALPGLAGEVSLFRSIVGPAGQVSGAGPTLYAISENREQADSWRERLTRSGRSALVTRFRPRNDAGSV